MNRTKVTIGVIGMTCSYIFGSHDAMLITLAIFMCIDFLSGLILALIQKEFYSSTFYIGVVKKIGILLIVVVATQLDKLVLGDHTIIRTAALSYYIACEGFSILENWGGLGLPLPKALKNALKKLREDDEDDD